MWNRLAQVGLTGVAVCGVEPVAAIFPVLLAGVYETGSIEGPLRQYCTLDKTVLVVLLLLVAVHWLPKRSTVKKEKKKRIFGSTVFFRRFCGRTAQISLASHFPKKKMHALSSA